MNLDRVIAVRNAKTIYQDGDRCVKVFNEDYSKADILNEALNQARIEETGLHIPKLLGVSMIEGKWAIFSEFIKGKTLSQLMKEDPDNKSKYLDRFVDIQMEVQSKTCPLLNRLKDKMIRKISQADLDATTRYDFDNAKWEDTTVKGNAGSVLRSRIQAEYDIPLCTWTPNASVELYNAWSVQKVRYTIGADWKINKKNSFSIYYRFQDNRGSSDDGDLDMHIIGLGYNFKF